jgi:hypothetical protein
MDGPKNLGPPWTYSSAFPIISVVFGCCLAISGAIAGLSPFLQRGEACLYAIAPPAEFVAKYAEGVEATRPHLSLFPFGAHCFYTAHATGEIAVSGVGLWPSVLIVVGTGLIVAGLFVATHRLRAARQQDGRLAESTERDAQRPTPTVRRTE